MSQHRAGSAPCYGTFVGAGLAQLFGTDAQKEKYLYPTLRGEKRSFFGLSEPSAFRPCAYHPNQDGADGDDWVINGGVMDRGADKADFDWSLRALTVTRAMA